MCMGREVCAFLASSPLLCSNEFCFVSDWPHFQMVFSPISILGLFWNVHSIQTWYRTRLVMLFPVSPCLFLKLPRHTDWDPGTDCRLCLHWQVETYTLPKLQRVWILPDGYLDLELFSKTWPGYKLLQGKFAVSHHYCLRLWLTFHYISSRSVHLHNK